MSPRDETTRLAEDLAFFGRITASATHQINNVLSILVELHGLLEDLLEPSREGEPVPAKKLADVTEQNVAEVARRYLAPEKLIFVIVGDRGKIEEEIRKLGLGAIEIRDADGNLIPR